MTEATSMNVVVEVVVIETIATVDHPLRITRRTTAVLTIVAEAMIGHAHDLTHHVSEHINLGV